jgi:hypothetical protein
MNAFDTLKRLLTSSPILGYADSTLPYERIRQNQESVLHLLVM